MAGPQLSNEELEDAAAEAGISPQELRHALAERQGGDLARPEQATSLMGPSSRGRTATFTEARIARPPSQALADVRGSIERQTGRSGHRQGDGDVDIVDSEHGLTYRIRAQDDGAKGALVRVEVDDSAARGFRTLATTGVVGTTLAIVGIAMLFGATTMLLGGIGFGILGGLLLVRRAARLPGDVNAARAIAAHALMEAEDEAGAPAAQSALPPAT